jgi:hypothetical protein
MWIPPSSHGYSIASLSGKNNTEILHKFDQQICATCLLT